MGEPQRSDDVESDRRSSPRFPAELLGKASVRLLGGSEVTLINFSERGILFQSETRLLVGARGTIRIVVGTETTIAAGTVVRSLVQGMASGKLAFHTALALDQPLALAAAVEARERAKAAASARRRPSRRAVEPEPTGAPEPAARAGRAARRRPGKTIEKRSHKSSAPTPDAVADRRDARAAGRRPTPSRAAAADARRRRARLEPRRARLEPPSVDARAAVPCRRRGAGRAASRRPRSAAGFGDSGFDGGSFGWSDPAAETGRRRAERAVRLDDEGAHGAPPGHPRRPPPRHRADDGGAREGRGHRRHRPPARRAAVRLRDRARGARAHARARCARRRSAPRSRSSCRSRRRCRRRCRRWPTPASSRRRPATCWRRRCATRPGRRGSRSMPRTAPTAARRPVLEGLRRPAGAGARGRRRRHHPPRQRARAPSWPTAPSSSSRPLASCFVAEDAPAIAKLIADGLAGGYDDTPVFTAPADGKTVQVVLQALSVLPGAGGRPELALRCELRAEEPAGEPAGPAGPDLAAELAALDREPTTSCRRCVDASRARADPPARGARRDRAARPSARAPRARRAARPARRSPSATSSAPASWNGAARPKIVELERVVADAARSEVAAARAQSQLAATTEELVDAAHRAGRPAPARHDPGRRRRAHRDPLRRRSRRRRARRSRS